MEEQDLFDKQELQMQLYGKNYVVTNYFPKLQPDEFSQRINQAVCRLYEVLNQNRPAE